MQSNEAIQKIANVDAPDITIGRDGGDIWGKGALAQSKIDMATSRATGDAEQDAKIAAVSQFTDLFG